MTDLPEPRHRQLVTLPSDSIYTGDETLTQQEHQRRWDLCHDEPDDGETAA